MGWLIGWLVGWLIDKVDRKLVLVAVSTSVILNADA